MNLNQQLSFSKQDLAGRLGVDIDAIKIKVARQITWRSGALGCPKPGMNYTPGTGARYPDITGRGW